MRSLYFCLLIGAVSCQREPAVVNTIPTPSDSTKRVSLDGSPNSCTGIVVNGSYTKNVPLDNTNTIVVKVQVTEPGAWNAATSEVNGIRFSGSGSFISLGNQTVTLQGSGTPINDGAFTWTVKTGSSQCSFEIGINSGIVSQPPPAPTGPPGSIFIQQAPLGNDTMYYDSSGRIARIGSKIQLQRRIIYGSQGIAIIEYRNRGNIAYSAVDSFFYDGHGDMVNIRETVHPDNTNYMYSAYEYDPDHMLKKRVSYGPPSTGYRVLVEKEFFYSNGNITRVIRKDAYGGKDTFDITYDSRINHFKNIYPQFYFLDEQSDFDPDFKMEVFYFSKNYPTSYGTKPISVSEYPGSQKPAEIYFDNRLLSRYIYH